MYKPFTWFAQQSIWLVSLWRNIGLILVKLKHLLNLKCIISQNDQTYFKNFAANASRFLKYAWPFRNINYIKGLSFALNYTFPNILKTSTTYLISLKMVDRSRFIICYIRIFQKVRSENTKSFLSFCKNLRWDFWSLDSLWIQPRDDSNFSEIFWEVIFLYEIFLYENFHQRRRQFSCIPFFTVV